MRETPIKSLDISGLEHFIRRIKDIFVEKIPGMGLSRNDYTDAEKAKLASLVPGGGVGYGMDERDTGLTWIEGSPIYQKTYIGNIEAEANEIAIVSLDSLTGDLIKAEYIWQTGDSPKSYCGSVDGQTSIAAYRAGTGSVSTLELRSVSPLSRSGTTYNGYCVTAWYTKNE
ncbi:MAG: hypothetical protein LBH66_06220 [Oscillospiraceae bacterium]|jgi:hypothetical protein|nr:hypothetical protein [Oscillospiraceae bacterium]